MLLATFSRQTRSLRRSGMRKNDCTSLITLVVALAAMPFAIPVRLSGQSPSVKSSAGSELSAMQWSVQVQQINPGSVDLSYSFQIAIYENLVAELNKTK